MRFWLYVDSILMLEIDLIIVEWPMDIIRTRGLEYVFELNECKVAMMMINGEEAIFGAGGSRIKSKESLVYPVSILSKIGRVNAELGRRIGSASQAFNELERLWKHANVSMTK